jgi:hypothetical protein
LSYPVGHTHGSFHVNEFPTLHIGYIGGIEGIRRDLGGVVEDVEDNISIYYT